MDIVIIGGGIAAANAARELRERGHEDGIVVLAAERHVPYERPPLSKGVLLGEATPESAHVLEQQWYDEHDVDLRTGTEATAIDLDRRQVHAGAESVPYERLLIATGATPRRLPDLEDAGVPVAYLRTIDDSLALKAAMTGSVLVVGAGWIGLEVAAAARLGGADVTVVEPAEQPLLAVLGPELGARFAELHRGHGVDLRAGHERRVGGPTASCASPTATSAPRPDGGRASAPCPTTGSRARPGSRSTTASWSTRPCAPATPTSSPSATSPTTCTPSWADGSASSTGTPPSTRAAPPPARCWGGRPLRADALLLHRPVRHGHGVRRQRGAGRPRPGGRARRRPGQGAHRALGPRRHRRRRHAGQRLGRHRHHPRPRRAGCAREFLRHRRPAVQLGAGAG